ncbi:hypothetical protein [Collimonas sp. OK412]|jgi:hypothetical protein|uniref:hypothetical protein n=1 Tax=Collimonas sp. (strain OK412) TaxID=1801619 RepID=UPI000B85E779|nr:hypothetical protein [Collimonas sp. OK412]
MNRSRSQNTAGKIAVFFRSCVQGTIGAGGVGGVGGVGRPQFFDGAGRQLLKKLLKQLLNQLNRQQPPLTSSISFMDNCWIAIFAP